MQNEDQMPPLNGDPIYLEPEPPPGGPDDSDSQAKLARNKERDVAKVKVHRQYNSSTIPDHKGAT